jgi:hypothetical protein
MAAAVYLLCALSSSLCALLLLRSWARNRVRLLLWSGLCFTALAVNNVLLFIDLIVLPAQVDLSWPRDLAALLGICLLLYGLVWDREV